MIKFSMDYPVLVEAEGIKIRPEKMETDKLYHCVYQDKIMIFYKVNEDMLNCYEISEKNIVDQVKQSKEEDIENLLQKYIDQNNLNH